MSNGTPNGPKISFDVLQRQVGAVTNELVKLKMSLEKQYKELEKMIFRLGERVDYHINQDTKTSHPQHSQNIEKPG